MTTNKTNTNILEPLVDSICECGGLLWKLISNNPNKIDWRAEFLALNIKNNEDYTPKFINRSEDDYRIEYLFTLPIGITVEKVEKAISRVATLHSTNLEYVTVERFKDKVKVVIDKGVFENEIFRFEDLDFKPKKNTLQIPVGYYLKDGKKTLLYIDLSISTQCHALIGGTSGYGKSNIVKSILAFVVNKYSYQDVNLVIADLKGTELPIFEKTLHCTKYTDSPYETPNIIKEMLNEMERRYKVLAQNRKRNIEDYNRARAMYPQMENLPFIVIVVDEFNDLVMQCSQ